MPKKHGWTPLLAGGCLFAALVAGPVSSAVAEEADANPAPRDFGGHLFIPAALVPDPFISTTFATNTGAGAAVNHVVPIYNLHGEKIAEATSEVGFLRLGFGYQQAITQRVALRLDLDASARVGTTPKAVLADGISALYGYGAGVTVNLARKTAWQLAATADLRGNTLYGVSPLGFVQSVVNSLADGDTTGALTAAEDSLLGKGTNTRVLAGVRAAYTPAPWIGFTGFMEGGMGERFQKGSHGIGVTNLGVAVSFDLDALTRYPFGLVGSFRNESLMEKGDGLGSAQSFGLGFFYTGRRFFSIGLENTWNRLSQPRTDKKIDVAQSRITLRYDFK
jgi:hypothetical protein